MYAKVKTTTIFFALICLSACATAKIIPGPDGTPHQLVSCGSMEKCYEKAAEVCGGKYKIINTTSDTSGFSNSPTSTSYNLLVKCEN